MHTLITFSQIRRRTALPVDIISTSRRHTGLLAGMSRTPIADQEEGEGVCV